MRKTKEDPFDYVKRSRQAYLPLINAVIFFDVVGFTKDTTNEEMKKIIRRIHDDLTEILINEFYWNEKRKPNDLILIPTGDGYAIGFHTSKFDSEKVLSIATDIFKKLTQNNGIKIRMGITRGPNIRYLDLNENNNLFGFGINIANRIMNLARGNQILIHEDMAKDILRNRKVEELTDVGEFPIKHGEKVRVFNYFKAGEFGNSDPPDKL